MHGSAKLYVYRVPFTSGYGAWRLLWAAPGDDSFVHAEGECSAKLFRTMRECIAYGQRVYGEKATKWRFGDDFV